MAKKTKNNTADPGTALVKYDEAFAAMAADVSAQEVMPGGNFISFKAGRISIAKKPVEGNKLDVVILDSIHENVYYGGVKYDPENPASPVCAAFGRTDDEMRAHPNQKAGWQNRQTVTIDGKEVEESPCTGCEKNAFGSAEEGNGKACKNQRRIAFIHADDLKSPAKIKEAEVMYAKLSPMNIKGWALYVKGLAATMKRPPAGVLTRISTVPDEKSQFKVTFEMLDPLPGELAGAILQKVQSVRETIAFPYQAVTQLKTPAKPAKGKDAGKKKGKKF